MFCLLWKEGSAVKWSTIDPERHELLLLTSWFG